MRNFYKGFDLKVFNDNILATLCASLDKISPVTPDIARIRIALFWTRRQKSASPTQYLSHY